MLQFGLPTQHAFQGTSIEVSRGSFLKGANGE